MESLQRKIESAFELFDQGHLLEAEQKYTACLNEIQNDSRLYEDALFGMGYVKAHLNKFNEARNIYKELIDLAIHRGEISEQAMYMHQLGMVERMAKNFEAALKIFEEESELLKVNLLHTDLTMAAILYEMGYIHLLKNHYDTALQLMEKSLKFAELSGDQVCIGCAYRGLGEIYNVIDNKELEKRSFEKAISAFKAANDEAGVKEVQILSRRS